MRDSTGNSVSTDEYGTYSINVPNGRCELIVFLTNLKRSKPWSWKQCEVKKLGSADVAVKKLNKKVCAISTEGEGSMFAFARRNTSGHPCDRATSGPGVARRPSTGGARSQACACGGRCPRCREHAARQRSLKVIPSADPSEREADRVTDMIVPLTNRPADLPSANIDAARLQLASDQTSMGDAPPIVHDVLRRPGRPLDLATRAVMEPRFGRDFSDVRVHTSQTAVESARAVNAAAYTVGRNVVFDAGRYQPETREGQRLLAHELTHVAQQAATGDPRPATGDSLLGCSSEAPVVLARQKASWSEKWAAVKAVGPFDAYTAGEIAKDSLTAARKIGLPGPEDGPADAWRHCFWNCNMATTIGKGQAKSIADSHETFGTGTPASHEMDLHNNAQGRDCNTDECLTLLGIAHLLGVRPSGVEKCKQCDDCCQQKLDAGDLRVIDAVGAVVASKATKRSGAAQSDYDY